MTESSDKYKLNEKNTSSHFRLINNSKNSMIRLASRFSPFKGRSHNLDNQEGPITRSKSLEMSRDTHIPRALTVYNPLTKPPIYRSPATYRQGSSETSTRINEPPGSCRRGQRSLRYSSSTWKSGCHVTVTFGELIYIAERTFGVAWNESRALKNERTKRVFKLSSSFFDNDICEKFGNDLFDETKSKKTLHNIFPLNNIFIIGIENLPTDYGNRIEQAFISWMKKMNKICQKAQRGLYYIDVDWI
jgi:hypothetical protein